jgi:ComF family protein
VNQRVESRERCTAQQGAGLVRLNKIGEAVADLIFPPRCMVCRRLGAWLCTGCMAEIEMICPPVCSQCGLPSDAHGADRPCSIPSPLDGLRACAFHSGVLREAIHEFKYQDLTALAVPLGRLMADAWAALDGNWLPQAVVPVPLHPHRQRQRGYNQSALLARELAAALQLPLMEGTLHRVKATVPQVDLDVEQRRINVLDAFRCQPGSLAGRSVLLVDDVCTTGATLASACQALKEAGASSVLAYTLARAKPPGYRQVHLESQSL